MNIRAVRSKVSAQDVTRQSEESTIYARIHAAIVERRILPGVRLVEDQLAEVFDVSRMRIRSVLQSLARDKVVTLHRNRGAVVAYPSVREAKEVFAARRLIVHREPAAGHYALVAAYGEEESVAPLAAPQAQFRVVNAF